MSGRIYLKLQREWIQYPGQELITLDYSLNRNAVWSMEIIHCNFKSLDGIELFPNLTELMIFNSSVRDFSIISNLKFLTVLSIESVFIDSFEFIQDLSELTYLTIICGFKNNISLKNVSILIKKYNKLKILNFDGFCHDDHKINFYKLSDLEFRKYGDPRLRNYQNRLKYCRKLILSLIIRNKIKIFWNLFLEAKKNGINRYCFLVNNKY